MFQSKQKCLGKDVRKSETLPKKDVELCLEVEMDDDVREIITSPEKCASTLLDVTVIKPKDLEFHCCHKATLSGEDVRKLIASMELEKQDKQKLIDRILSGDDPKSSGDYVKKKHTKKVQPSKTDRQRVSTTDDTNSDPVFTYKQKPCKKCDERVQQIYTSPKTYNDIKSIFTCKNRNKYDEKSDKPCLCKNCAIIGVLTDSQKRPFITENLYDPREMLSNTRKESKESKRKKLVNFKNDPDDHLECEYYFKHLSMKIRQLEERLSLQEEKSVPRDYFKRIITKLVTHLGKITNYAGYESSTPRGKTKETKEYKAKERYCIHPVLIDQKSSKVDIEESTFNAPNKQQLSADGFWRWGEEILKPGVDLKNKIVTLLEETLQSLKRPRSVPSKLRATEKIVSDSVEVPQKLQDEPVRDLPCNSCKSPLFMNSNLSRSTVPKPKKSRSYEKKVRKLLHNNKHDFACEDSLNVSYLNPQLRTWQQESQVSFKFDSSLDSFRCPEEKKLNDAYKAEFKETLSNTKEADKLKLWHSVWTQAKMNGQSRDDKVTIQMPDRKNLKINKTVEIEYTIAELEELLLGLSPSGHRHNTKKRSDRK